MRDVIYPMLSALAYMHSENIVHRDVKARGTQGPGQLRQPTLVLTRCHGAHAA